MKTSFFLLVIGLLATGCPHSVENSESDGDCPGDCTNAECNEPSCTPPEGMTSTFYLDGHAHIMSCDLFLATTNSTDPDSCNAGNPSVPPNTVDQYLAQYVTTTDTGSNASVVHLISAAYQWSAPGIGTDGYVASQQEIANVQRENDYAASQATLGNEMAEGVNFIPLGSVNPKKDYALDEIDRCASDLGMRGLKLHFSNSQVDMRDPETQEWVRQVLIRANQRGLYVLVHFGDLNILCGCCTDGSELDPEAMIGAMEAMLTVLADDDLNGLHIQFAHLTGVGNFPDWTQKTFSMLIDAYKNNSALRDVEIFVDVAAVFSTCADTCGTVPGVTDQDLQIMGEMLEMWGFDRVIWGSDNNPDSIGPMQCLWPLSVEKFNQLATTSGFGLLTEP